MNTKENKTEKIFFCFVIHPTEQKIFEQKK